MAEYTTKARGLQVGKGPNPANLPVDLGVFADSVNAAFDQSVDAQFAALASGMTAYTPTINFNCGTNTGWWKRVDGSDLVICTGKQIIASGQVPSGTAALTFGLPVQAAVYPEIIGTGMLARVSGGSSIYLPMSMYAVTSQALGAWFSASGITAATRFMGNTFGSWAVGDSMFYQVAYRGVPA